MEIDQDKVDEAVLARGDGGQFHRNAGDQRPDSDTFNGRPMICPPGPDAHPARPPPWCL